jgi:hypothetical protein
MDVNPKRKPTMRKHLLLASAFAISTTAFAIESETPESSCSGVMKLVEKGDYKAALTEARFCVEVLEQKMQGAVTAHFSESVAGWTRNDLREESVLGMSNITAEYSKGDATLTVSLIGGQGSGGAFGGALGSIAQMGMMQSGKRVRIQGLPATIDPQGKVTIQLNDGAFISVSSPQYQQQDTALEALEPFLDAFPFSKINEARS